MALFKRRKPGPPKAATGAVGDDIEDRPFTTELEGEPCLEPETDSPKIEPVAPKHQISPSRPTKRPPNRHVVVLWGIAFVFALVWVFVLGIIVGRGAIFSNHLFQEFADRLTGVPTGRPAPVVELAGPTSPSAQPPDSDTKLTFYDSLSKAPAKEPHGTKIQPDKPAETVKTKLSESVSKPKSDTVTKAPEPDRNKAADSTIKSKPKSETTTKTQAQDAGSSKTTDSATRLKSSTETPTSTKTADNLKTKTAEQPVKSSSGSEATATADAKNRNKPDSTAKEKTGVDFNPGPDPTNVKPPVRKSGDNFSIQVATTSESGEANRLTSALKAKGFDAYYYTLEVNGRKYYRVRVGRYGNRDDAKGTMDKLSAAGQKNMYISALTD
ncbi:MAG: SPOR domain-containing protein [Deltaproteobacteria bacterium]|nr:SPOR domain-containing protein [Deltaproteobacteria bacterium]